MVTGVRVAGCVALLSLAACHAAAPRVAVDADPAAAFSCSREPHCVSTRAARREQYMEPILYAGSVEAAQSRLREILARHPRTEITDDRPGLLAASFRSLVFRFVDDAVFQFDPSAHVIHFRSSSRVGYYDFGVNRERMDEIQRAFAAR